jgi:TatD DNase family protein
VIDSFGPLTPNTQNPTPLWDTHCHLNHEDYARDLSDVLRRAQYASVSHIVCASYDLESSLRAVELAGENRMISASVGVHPHDADTFSPEIEDRLKALASEEKVVAIGETGLDYYRDLSPRDAQQAAFRRHIRLAVELDLPLIIHSRDAQQDVIRILAEEGLPPRGVVMHCLPSDPEFAGKSLEMGCYVGIGGPVTFQNAGTLREIVAGVPLDRLLLETDAPYLTPHPYRGKRNEPSYLPLVAEKIAEIKAITPAEVAEITTSNARTLFRIQGPG